MCGRFALHHLDQEMRERFEALLSEDSEPMEPRYNVSPGQPITTVLAQGEERHLKTMKWGLIPAWAKDAKRPLINVRADTLAEKPYFRTALSRRRCLVPASGFYEWKEADNPEEGGKTPFYFHPVEEDLIGLAGIWEERLAGDGSSLLTCSLITTEPNGLLGLVHNRMPVILPRSAEAAWLDNSLQDAADLLPLLLPYADGLLEAFPVSRRVNTPAHDTALCIQPDGQPLRVHVQV